MYRYEDLTMAILSKRLISDVRRRYHDECNIGLSFMDLSGDISGGTSVLCAAAAPRHRRNSALHESVAMGAPYVFEPVQGVVAWVIGLEDRRMIHGAVVGGEVFIEGRNPSVDKAKELIVANGVQRNLASKYLDKIETWSSSRVTKAATQLQKVFYDVSGWRAELMNENRLRLRQEEQLNQAIADRRNREQGTLYAFEKERVLLAGIRAGDRNGARRILNEMLAAIYMSSPKLVVLRARVIALISYLTRAAIEDNPMMEPLIERNHQWTERLITARSFEDLSTVLMAALDDFMDDVYIHGTNWSNAKVRKALEYIAANYMRHVSLNEIAKASDLSASRLSHLVKEFTGKTVLQIVQETRVRQAQRLLSQSSQSCTEIAYEVGFGDQSYFIKHFRRITGTTPSRFRRGQMSVEQTQPA